MKVSAILLAAAWAPSWPAGLPHSAEPVVVLAQAADSGGKAAASLAGTEWKVLQLDGKDAAAGVTSTLAFVEGGGVNGNGGCNNFRGDVEVDGATMKFGLLASTMMACEEAKSTQEALFHAAMEHTASYSVEDGKLNLIDAAGTVVARLGKP